MSDILIRNAIEEQAKSLESLTLEELESRIQYGYRLEHPTTSGSIDNPLSETQRDVAEYFALLIKDHPIIRQAFCTGTKSLTLPILAATLAQIADPTGKGTPLLAASAAFILQMGIDGFRGKYCV